MCPDADPSGWEVVEMMPVAEQRRRLEKDTAEVQAALWRATEQGNRVERAVKDREYAERELASEREKRELLERLAEAEQRRANARSKSPSSLREQEAIAEQDIVKLRAALSSLDAGEPEPTSKSDPTKSKLLEFDAWLSFRPEFYEVLDAFRSAFATDTSAAAIDAGIDKPTRAGPVQVDDDRPERVHVDIGDSGFRADRDGLVTMSRHPAAADPVTVTMHLSEQDRHAVARMWSPSLPVDREALIERVAEAEWNHGKTRDLWRDVQDRELYREEVHYTRERVALAVDALAGVVPDGARDYKRDFEREQQERMRLEARVVELEEIGGRGLPPEPSEEAKFEARRVAWAHADPVSEGCGTIREENIDALADTIVAAAYRVDASYTEPDGGGHASEALAALREVFLYPEDDQWFAPVNGDDGDYFDTCSEALKATLNMVRDEGRREPGDAGLLAVLRDPPEGLLAVVGQTVGDASDETDTLDLWRMELWRVADWLSEHRGVEGEEADPLVAFAEAWATWPYELQRRLSKPLANEYRKTSSDQTDPLPMATALTNVLGQLAWAASTGEES